MGKCFKQRKTRMIVFFVFVCFTTQTSVSLVKIFNISAFEYRVCGRNGNTELVYGSKAIHPHLKFDSGIKTKYSG